jgi:hypothetical protein
MEDRYAGRDQEGLEFVNSDTVRWLVDAENGGPPRAFECLAKLGLGSWHFYKDGSGVPCGRVTKTLSGMRSHQRVVHGFKAQADLYEGNHAEGEKTALKRS